MPYSSLSPVNTVANTSTKYTKLYNNPSFDYLTEMLPRDIKDLFKYCELVYSNAPVITNGIKKLVSYPVTDFTYKTESKKKREETKELVEKTLNLRSALINTGINYYIYGNVFGSVYFPFNRSLKCKTCSEQFNVRHTEYTYRETEIKFKCGVCGGERRGEFVDEDSNDVSRVRLVTWNPKDIDLFYNPITGDTAYYYQIPRELRQGILGSDPTVLNTLPKVFLEAVRKKRMVAFGKNLYHFKAPSIAGYNSGWGISPMLPALKSYLYVSILRKASEAIGLEHITPKTVLFPQGINNDPAMAMQIGKWREETQKAMERWRHDPNHVMMSPMPTGVANIGSQGKNLMPTNEIKDAKTEMALALDVPPEFIFGSTNLQNSTVALRILENQLASYVDQLNEYANWVIRLINAKFKKDYCEIELTPFSLVDDMVQKQLILQSAGSIASHRTAQEALKLDPDEEEEKMIEDQVNSARVQKEVERRVQEHEQDLASRVQEEAAAKANNTIPDYDQQAIIAQADMLAQQLIAIPYEERKSYLSDLQNEDAIMWAVVSKRLEDLHEERNDQRRADEAAEDQPF